MTIIVCTPYFVKLNNNTFQLKRYYSLFFTAKENRKSHFQLSNLQCCHCDISVLRVAIISMFKLSAFSVDIGWQTTPPLVDSVVHNGPWSSSRHTEIRRSRSSSTSLTSVSCGTHAACPILYIFPVSAVLRFDRVAVKCTLLYVLWTTAKYM